MSLPERSNSVMLASSRTVGCTLLRVRPSSARLRLVVGFWGLRARQAGSDFLGRQRSAQLVPESGFRRICTDQEMHN